MTIVTHSVHTKGIHVLTCSPDAGMMLTDFDEMKIINQINWLELRLINYVH